MIWKRLYQSTKGATAIEYALIVALIALTIMGAVQSLGGGTSGMWTWISDQTNIAFNGANGG